MFVSSNLLRLFQDTGRFRERLEERGRGVEAPWAESGTQEIKMPDWWVKGTILLEYHKCTWMSKAGSQTCYYLKKEGASQMSGKMPGDSFSPSLVTEKSWARSIPSLQKLLGPFCKAQTAGEIGSQALAISNTPTPTSLPWRLGKERVRDPHGLLVWLFLTEFSQNSGNHSFFRICQSSSLVPYMWIFLSIYLTEWKNQKELCSKF